MYQSQVTVINKLGLHARPSAKIVQEALKYNSCVKITNKKENITADAKGVLEVLLLNASYGSELIISAEGKDEKEAVECVINKIKELSEGE